MFIYLVFRGFLSGCSGWVGDEEILESVRGDWYFLIFEFLFFGFRSVWGFSRFWRERGCS